MPHIQSGGIKLFFEEYGRVYPIIFSHEFEADVRIWEAELGCVSRACRCIKTDLAINSEEPAAAFGTQLRRLLSAIARASGLHADPQNGLSSGPEKPRTTQWCFGGGRA